jgi:urocanate hydratase
VDTLEEAMTLVEAAVAEHRPLSVGLLGNAAEIYAELVQRGITPDVVTDQTSAHDPLNGYVPAGLDQEAAAALRQAEPQEYVRRSRASMARHVEAMLSMQARGAIAFDYGNNLRAEAQQGGVERAFDIPGFVPAFIRPLFCEGKGPFAGLHSPAIPKTFTAPTKQCLICFRKIKRYSAGFAKRSSMCTSRACPRASAGWAMESGPALDCTSTNWCATARYRHRS